MVSIALNQKIKSHLQVVYVMNMHEYVSKYFALKQWQ